MNYRMKRRKLLPGENEPQLVEAQPSFKKDLLDTGLSLLVMAVLVFLILHFVGQRVYVDGTSMNNTLQDRDQLVEDKFTYCFLHEPERYDIVIIRLKTQNRKYYIKRIIGLPGETIQITDSVIYINGEAIDDPYSRVSVFDGGSAEEPITLGEGEYFVMGDNRSASEDSRYSLGVVERSQIKGRAVLRFWPLKSFGSLKGK